MALVLDSSPRRRSSSARRPLTHVYAQTFPSDPVTKKPVATSLQALFQDATLSEQDTIVVYLAALHVGTDVTGKPYLHLNNDDVDTLDDFFRDVYRRSREAVCTVDLRVMLGGAGGAYTALFADFEPRYALLRNFLQKYPFLNGVDLDIEEVLDPDATQALAKVQRLLTRLHDDFVAPRDRAPPHVPPFHLSMAPVAGALLTDAPGLGGFSYQELQRSAVGAYVTQFNVQAYGCFTVATFHAIVKEGFLPETLVFGMLGNSYGNATTFARAMTALETICLLYPTFGGTIVWEYGDTAIDGVAWEQAVRRALIAGGSRAAVAWAESGEESCADTAAVVLTGDTQSVGATSPGCVNM